MVLVTACHLSPITVVIETEIISTTKGYQSSKAALWHGQPSSSSISRDINCQLATVVVWTAIIFSLDGCLVRPWIVQDSADWMDYWKTCTRLVEHGYGALRLQILFSVSRRFIYLENNQMSGIWMSRMPGMAWDVLFNCNSQVYWIAINVVATFIFLLNICM